MHFVHLMQIIVAWCVPAGSIRAADLTHLQINLYNGSKRHEKERAVLTLKQSSNNSKALLWIPGFNDSFFHVHVMDRFIDAGFDLYALDLRRCGQSITNHTQIIASLPLFHNCAKIWI